MSADASCPAAYAYVRGELKSPSSANFDSCNSATVTELGQNRWRVESNVEATNSFGGAVRTPFSAVVRYNETNDEWTGESVQLFE
jgi:hypothetical protein